MWWYLPCFLCTVGFSAVLFALKFLMHRLEEQQRAGGGSWEDFGFVTVPKHLAIWTELLIVQLIVPNASFLGHLAGVLAGLIYVNLTLPFKANAAENLDKSPSPPRFFFLFFFWSKFGNS